jgi:hypothetical protein
VALQADMLDLLRREFGKKAIAFASHVGEMRGIIVVDAKSGQVVDIRKSSATECDTLTWDDSGILRSEFAEFTVTVNMIKGTFEARASAATVPEPIATATVHQCMTEFVAELMRNRQFPEAS